MGLRRRALAGFDRAVFALMRHAPTPVGQAVAGVIARHLSPRLYPPLDARARAAVPLLRLDLPPGPTVAALWDNLTRTASEVACQRRLHAEGRVEVAGEAALLALHRAGRPVILAGLHLGNWEIMGLALTGLGLPVAAIHDPPPETEYRGQVLTRMRRETGVRLLPLGRDATFPALRSLREGREVLYMLVDEVTAGRVAAPALGRPLPRTGNLVQAVRLARLTGAAILPGFALRLPGPRFRATFLPPVEVPRSTDREADIAAGVAALDAAIAAPVLAHLEQWFPLLYWRRE